MNLLVIDWFALYRNCLYSLLSGGKPITRATEVDEVRFRIARKIFKLTCQDDYDMVIIAKDYKQDGKRKYWREQWLTDWYLEHHEQLKSGDNYYLRFDNKTYLVHMNEGGVHREMKPLTKKDTPKDLEKFIYAESDVIEPLLPKYKGRRISEWIFEMDKAEFDKAMDQTAIDICGLFKKHRIVEVHNAEADDIGAVISIAAVKKGNTCTLVTHDSDWYQLLQPGVRIWNLSHEQWMEEELDLTHKILKGDSGDGISATWVDGKAGGLGEKKARDVLDQGRIDEVNKAVLARNTKLITLDQIAIPSVVWDAILQATREPQVHPKTSWEDFTLTRIEQEYIQEEYKPILTRRLK